MKKRILAAVMALLLCMGSVTVTATENEHFLTDGEGTFAVISGENSDGETEAGNIENVPETKEPQTEALEAESKETVNNGRKNRDAENSQADISLDDSGYSEFKVAEYGFCQRNGEAQEASLYPQKYDPRPLGLTSEIRSQIGNSCWLFAAMAAVEANLLKKGYVKPDVDLSELQILYFMAKGYDDPLGYYTTDTNKGQGAVSEIVNGGNSMSAYDFLSRFHGPVDEKEASLETYTGGKLEKLDEIVLGTSLANQSRFHLNAVRACDYDSGRLGDVKKLITNYGAVSAGYRTMGNYYCASEEGGDASYYYDKLQTPNHAVSIVGWDDNYPKENFRQMPDGNGAWLVKDSNAYPTVKDKEQKKSYQTSGYFWLSYYDANICAICAVDFDTPDKYENLYAYDAGGAFVEADTAGAGIKENGYKKYAYPLGAQEMNMVKANADTFLNVYTAKAYEGEAVERIDGVMVYLGANTPYEITVFANPKIKDNCLVGYCAKSGTIKGRAEETGIYTIPLEEPVYVAEGNTFGVSIRVSGGKHLGMAYGTRLEGECYFGEGYGLFVDEKVYCEQNGKDCADADTPFLRALTNRAGQYVFATDIDISKQKVTLQKGMQEKLTVNVLPQNATNKSAGYYTSNPNVAVADEDGTITAVGCGSCVITAKSYDARAEANCQVTVTEKQAPIPEKPQKEKEQTIQKFASGSCFYELKDRILTVTKIKDQKNIKIPAKISYQNTEYAVTEIAPGAGANLKNAVSITIPGSVTKIGSNAFKNCGRLSKVTIGANVTDIGSKAFYNCPGLKSVTIKSKKLEKVGKSAFQKIKKGAVIRVPKSKKKEYIKLLSKKTGDGTKIK